jgi:proteasome assembly chaperone (PAC2) family protein
LSFDFCLLAAANEMYFWKSIKNSFHQLILVHGDPQGAAPRAFNLPAQPI